VFRWILACLLSAADGSTSREVAVATAALITHPLCTVPIDQWYLEALPSWCANPRLGGPDSYSVIYGYVVVHRPVATRNVMIKETTVFRSQITEMTKSHVAAS
jgi:hypothetical protein